MNHALQWLLATHHGVVGWSAACAAVSADAVEWASRSGAVVRPYPGVIADPAVWWPAPEPWVRWRAAVMAAGPEVALSHTTALAVWQLPVPEEARVYLLTGPGSADQDSRDRWPPPYRVRGRAAGRAQPPGLPVTCLEGSIVDAWPLLSDDDQRAPLIRAVGERMTTPARVRLVAPTNLSQRGALVRLLDLLDVGCRSPLEIWGYERVFTGPGFERLCWQVPIRAKGRRYWLDAFDEATLTNFELDGAKYHSSPRSRELDLARDAALATVGIHAVRYSHRRLTHEVREVRAEALAIMAARRHEHWTPIRARRAS